MTHKAGFVNIIGNPNVGKSTLMNAMVGEQLSIITPKAQTTRHRILGIVNNEQYQIVFSDTPGILTPKYKLQEAMLKSVYNALEDSDVIIYVTDLHEKTDKNPDFIERINKVNIPVLLIINKTDLSTQENVKILMDEWAEKVKSAEIIPISALHNFNLEKIFQRILELLPLHPPYYPKDTLTDKNKRFFVSEIIREKIMTHYKKEIPYAVEVEIESFKETEKIINITSYIYVERTSQKGIIIGHRGEALKKTASEARKNIEDFLQKKVFLEIFVKVNKDWKNKPLKLKKFGYQ